MALDSYQCGPALNDDSFAACLIILPRRYDSVYLSQYGDLDVGSTGVTIVPDNSIAAYPKLLLVCGE